MIIAITARLISIILIYIYIFIITITHKNFKKRKLTTSYYIITGINLLISSITIYLILIYINLSNNMLPNILNIVMYYIILDTIYYWVHRLLHKIPVLKKIIHSTHHDKTSKLLPLDIFYVEYNESIMYGLFIFIPLLFISISKIDLVIIMMILLYHLIYTHSDSKQPFIIPLFIDSAHHKHHHKIGGGCNYSVFLSIWDDYMKTTIKPKKMKKHIHSKFIK